MDARSGGESRCDSGEYRNKDVEDFTPNVFVFHDIKFKFYKWYFNSLPLFEGTPSKTEGELVDSNANQKFLPCLRGGGPRSGGGVGIHQLSAITDPSVATRHLP